MLRSQICKEAEPAEADMENADLQNIVIAHTGWNKTAGRVLGLRLLCHFF